MMMPRSDILALTFGLVSTVIGIFTILTTLLVMHCRRARRPHVHDPLLWSLNSYPSTPPQIDNETALVATPNHHHAAAQENGHIYHAIGDALEAFSRLVRNHN